MLTHEEKLSKERHLSTHTEGRAKEETTGRKLRAKRGVGARVVVRGGAAEEGSTGISANSALALFQLLYLPCCC